MRLNFQAVVPTFNRRRPISQDGKAFALPRTVPGAGTLNTQQSNRLSELLSITDQFNSMSGLGGLKLSPSRYHAVLHVPPQRHQQPPRQGHDADAAHAFAAAGEALLKP